MILLVGIILAVIQNKTCPLIKDQALSEGMDAPASVPYQGIKHGKMCTPILVKLINWCCFTISNYIVWFYLFIFFVMCKLFYDDSDFFHTKT